MAGHIASFLRFGPDAAYHRGKTEQVNMRHIRSADPWSTFLEPDERVAPLTRYLDPGARHDGEGRPGNPGHAGPHEDVHEDPAGSPPDPAHDSSATSADGDLPDAGRRLLAELSSAHGALTVEQLHDRSGLTLLEIADAVRVLRARGLVGLRRDGGDEVVEVTGTGHAGRHADQ